MPDDIEVNARGGRQSRVASRLDLVPPSALLAVGEVMHFGAERYERNNWRRIDVDDHINHALVHIYKHLAGDDREPHLQHAATRLLMALEIELTGVLDDG